MVKYCYTLCFLFSLYINGIAQGSVSFPSIDTGDLPDAVFEIPETYTGASLFGYMNGGAELYREYGFSGAWINEIHMTGGQYIIEIFRMNGPEEAYGIFSVSRYRCRSSPFLSPFTCQTPYQLQICSGPFYINIINQTGNTSDSVASLRIGEAIVKKITEEPADINGYLPGIPTETVNRETVLVKGELAIMNGAPDLVDYFGEAGGYCAVILKHEKETLLSVRFLNSEALDAFASRHAWTMETISARSVEMPSGETITMISDHHLLIAIRE